MAQYVVLFNNYTDITKFDSTSSQCVFVGPITFYATAQQLYITPFGKPVATEICTTNPEKNNFLVGKEKFKSFTIFSEDIPAMLKYIGYAENSNRLLSYSEYGFLNSVKYSQEPTTIGILAPNTKTVGLYLESNCSKKAYGQINPEHPAIVIFKKFDHNKKGYIILAHSISETESGKQIIETTEAWFNYLTKEQQLFPDDTISSLTHDAVYNLDHIGEM